MRSRLFDQKGIAAFRAVVISVVLASMVLGLTMCGTPEPTTVPTKEAPPVEEKTAILAIEHFSIIEGTTWSGAHDRAGKR